MDTKGANLTARIMEVSVLQSKRLHVMNYGFTAIKKTVL